MQIQGYSRGQTIKTVTIANDGNYTDDEVVNFAIQHAGETRGSLFGWTVNRDFDEPVIVVTLHTD